jgi:hypothetical protein
MPGNDVLTVDAFKKGRTTKMIVKLFILNLQ